MPKEFKLESLNHNLVQRRSFLLKEGYVESNGELVMRVSDTKTQAIPYPFKEYYFRDRYGKPVELKQNAQGHDVKVMHPLL